VQVVLLSRSDGVGAQGVSVTTGVLHGAPEAGAMSLAARPPQEEVSGVSAHTALLWTDFRHGSLRFRCGNHMPCEPTCY
jgi:hypothetical protein